MARSSAYLNGAGRSWRTVLRAAMTSLSSPKIDRAWQASERPKHEEAVGSISPSDLVHIESIDIGPWTR